MSREHAVPRHLLSKMLDTSHLLRYHAVRKRGKADSDRPIAVALYSVNQEHAGPSNAVWGSQGSLLLAACGRGVK